MIFSLSIAAGITALLANASYIVSILRGKTQPTRGSWITWGLLDVAVLAGMHVSGTVNGQIVGGTIGSVCVMILACLGWGKPGWTQLEKMCLCILPVGLFLWWITDIPALSIGISLILIIVGCFPTYESAWHKPSRESRSAWTLMTISSLLMLPTLPAVYTWWSLEPGITVVAQPLVFFLTQIPMVYFVWFHSVKPAQVDQKNK